jgi:hypothetical protein
MSADELKMWWDARDAQERRRRLRLGNQPFVYGQWDEMTDREQRMVSNAARVVEQIEGRPIR